MSRIVDYQYTIQNGILNAKAKSFIDNKDFDNIKANCSNGYVLSGMEYRPDLIADYYLGSYEYAWLLQVVNGFTNGVKDFTPGRLIKIPDLRLL